MVLDVDTSDCSVVEEGGREVCQGEVTVKLEYTATSSTPDPQFVSVGQNFGLRKSGASSSTSLSHTTAPPSGAEGDKLSATITLGTVPCSGGTLDGTAEIVAGSFVIQTIQYEVEINACGNVSNVDTTTSETTRPGRVSTPLRDITEQEDGSTPENPYPDYPGTPRSSGGGSGTNGGGGDNGGGWWNS